MGKFRSAAVALLITLSVVSSSYAVAGVGFHWGADGSMSMKNNPSDRVSIPLLNQTAGFDLEGLPSGQVDIINGRLSDLGLPLIQSDLKIDNPKVDFVRISRTNFKGSPLNIGAKVYVDIIPIIDAVELSGNLGVWQYDGVLEYLDITDPANVAAGATGGDLKYSNLSARVDEYREGGFLGLKATPYAKLQLDATVRKNVFKLPLDLLKLYAGGGLTVNFTTPILSSNIVSNLDALKNYTAERMIVEFTDPGSNLKDRVGEEIVNDIIAELLTPRIGMHIVAGGMVKVPVAPIGFYVDGKLMIPFTKFDENGDVKGLGFMANLGIALAF